MPGSLRLCICPLLFCLKKKEGDEEERMREREAHSIQSATGVVHILGGRRTIDREIERLRRSSSRSHISQRAS